MSPQGFSMSIHIDNPASRLEEIEDQFVESWNSMATLWGISPTMARIHGLLYISGADLSMEDIMRRLAISRGNVSMNLAKLVEWGLVHRVHKKGDRKEYFASITDLWEMFTLVAKQRKQREIDPLLSSLRRCKEQLSGPLGDDEGRARRINDLWKFLTMVDSLAQRFFDSHRGLRAAIEILAQDDH
jgi:DNA-binding transcriptional regulator GbsR (MarR family)